MGSSARKKKEKKKDFQVSFDLSRETNFETDVLQETQVKGWEDCAESCQFHEYRVQGQM